MSTSILLSIFPLFWSSIAMDNLYVDTIYGTIVGYTDEAANIWSSIPFAAPPIGELRFEPPQPHSQWTGVLNAMDDPVGCLQNCTLAWWSCPRIVDENCLYLNVIAPIDASPTNQKSVMFFIHGGDYLMGYSGGLIYNATSFVNLTDVIVVAANYRLGAQGFLYDETTGLMGNYGYLDQVFAMEWVYQNIEKFGGNKDDITIFGESAGGVSVATHLLNTSNTMIKAAIIESDPFGLPLRTTKTWGELPNLLKTEAGCSTLRSVDEQMKCLKDISATDLLAAQLRAENNLAVEYKWFIDLFMPWTPTVGTGIINEQPLFAIQNGDYIKDIPIVAGTNLNEGILFVWKAFPTALSRLEYEGFMALVFDNVEDAEAVLEYYKGYNVTNSSDYRLLLSQIATDSLFRCATRNISNVIALDKKNKALNYLYHFNAHSTFANVAYPNDPECWDKVCHGLELGYVFEPDLAPVNSSYTSEEWELAQTMGYYWSSIAKNKKTGSGNPKRPVEWKAFGGGGEQNDIIFDLQSVNGGVKMDTNGDVEICSFWDSLNYNWIPSGQ